MATSSCEFTYVNIRAFQDNTTHHSPHHRKFSARSQFVTTRPHFESTYVSSTSTLLPPANQLLKSELKTTMTLMKMSKKKSSNGNDDDVGRPRTTHRAWKLLRLALLWARKGGVFRRRLMMELRIVPKLLKSSFVHLLMQQKQQKQHQYCFERQLSFDKTPIFPTLKTKTSCSRSSSMCFINNIPCLKAPLVLDYFDDDQVDMIINNHGYQSNDCRYCYYDDDDEDDASAARQSFLIKCDEKDDGRDIIQDDEEERVTLSPATVYKNNIYEELEESVDIKADEFIAKFYQQMKLQRQISYRHHTQNYTC